MSLCTTSVFGLQFGGSYFVTKGYIGPSRKLVLKSRKYQVHRHVKTGVPFDAKRQGLNVRLFQCRTKYSGCKTDARDWLCRYAIADSRAAVWRILTILKSTRAIELLYVICTKKLFLRLHAPLSSQLTPFGGKVGQWRTPALSIPTDWAPPR